MGILHREKMLSASKPAIDLRKTGISIVGDVPWGTHFCYFYETKQDLLDILVPYFKAGLESKEFCLWTISNSDLITTEEAKGALEQAVSDLDRYLAEGRIERDSARTEWLDVVHPEDRPRR